MGFLEFLNQEQAVTTQRGETVVNRLSNLGVIGFGPGLTDKTVVRTPHYEIGNSLEMFELNTLVNSAVNQLVSFIIPNKTVKIASKDENTVEWLEEWHEQRKTIVEEFKNILTTGIISGNGIIETLFYEENGCDVLDDVFSYNDVSRVYVNPDVSEDGHDAFILKLPVGMKNFVYRGKPRKLDYYQVKYIKNYQYTMQRVYGVLISSTEFFHWKRGWSRDNIYGRSSLTSALDANNIYKELLSTWDTVIKTRRKDVKLYSVADAETGKRYSQKQLDSISEKLQDQASSIKLINIPLKVTETEFKNTGTYDLFTGIFDIVRRMIMMSLLPQHLTPWNDSATTQGSESSMPPFLLRIKTLQNEFIQFLNNAVISNLRLSEPWLSEDATYVFDEPMLLGPESYIRNITDMIREGLITADQGKRYLLKMGIIDKEVMEDNQKTVGTLDGGRTKAKDQDKDKKDKKEILVSYEQFMKEQEVRRESL